MVALAIDRHDGLQLDLRELGRDGPSYTVDTLLELRSQMVHDNPLAILIGADSLLSLKSWSRWEKVLELAHIVVADRPGKNLESSDLLGLYGTEHVSDLHARASGRIFRLKQRQHAVSATAIREAVASCDPTWTQWVDPAVAKFIREHGLYGYAPMDTDLN